MQWQVRALDAVAKGLAETGFEQAVLNVVGDSKLLLYPIRFELIEAGTALAGRDETRRIRGKILAAVERGIDAGSFRRMHQDALWAFRVASDGRVVAASIARSDVQVHAPSMVPALAFVLIVSVGCALMIATLVS